MLLCLPTSLSNVSLSYHVPKYLLTVLAWIRIIFCQGPRQVVNALTLYSVFKAKLDPTEASNVGSSILTFFKNIGILADEEHQQAVILSGMVFTLVIWIFGALSLILGLILYLLFLWHYIPNDDGGLSGYCERKINERLSKIVSAKVDKALQEEERKRNKADAKAAKNGEKPRFGRQATLPTLFDQKSDDTLPNMPMLNRNDTMTTLPVYESRPGTPGGQPALPGFELDELNQKRPFPSRNATGRSAMSNTSYSSKDPLMGNASDMGFSRSASPAPSLPPLDTNDFPSAPQRTMTGNSNNTQWNRGPPSGPPRMPSAMGDRGYTQSPVSYNDPPSPQSAIDPYSRPKPRAVGGLRSNTPMAAPSTDRRTPFEPNYPGGWQSPALDPSSDYGRNSPAPSNRGITSPTSNGGYRAFNPQGPPSNLRRISNAPPSNPATGGPQYRNVTDPGLRGPPPGGDYFANSPMLPRPGTAQSGSGRGTPSGGPRIGNGEVPARLASPAPYQNGLSGRGSPMFGPGPGNAAQGQGQGSYRQ